MTVGQFVNLTKHDSGSYSLTLISESEQDFKRFIEQNKDNASVFIGHDFRQVTKVTDTFIELNGQAKPDRLRPDGYETMTTIPNRAINSISYFVQQPE